jgi:hypothetical protein
MPNGLWKIQNAYLTNDNVNNKQPLLCMYSPNIFDEKLSNKIVGLVKVHLFVVMFKFFFKYQSVLFSFITVAQPSLLETTAAATCLTTVQSRLKIARLAIQRARKFILEMDLQNVSKTTF